MNGKQDPRTVYSREQKNITLDPINELGLVPRHQSCFFSFLQKSPEPTKSNRSFAMSIHRASDLLIFFGAIYHGISDSETGVWMSNVAYTVDPCSHRSLSQASTAKADVWKFTTHFMKIL